MTDDPDLDRLRSGLRGLAGEGSPSHLDTLALREQVRRRARRVQTRRRVAVAIATVIPVVAGAYWFLGPQLGDGDGTPIGPASPTGSGTVAPSPSPTQTASRTAPPRESTLRIDLRVTSGPASPEGGTYVAKWEVTWRGGTAPVYQVLIEEPGERVRSSTETGARCDGPVGPGSAHGEVLFDSPGPHEIIAVVRSRDCEGQVDRQTDTDNWTWTAPTATP